MHFPYFMRHVNRVFTNPVLGTVAWLVPPLAIVHHTGRKTGRAYRSPVVAVRSPTGFVIPLTYGRDVDWGRNMLAAGGCELERAGGRIRLENPRMVGFEQARSQLAGPARAFFGALDLPGFVLTDAVE